MSNAQSPSNLFEIGLVLVQRRRFITMSIVVGVLMICVAVLLMPNKYTSKASILPTSKRSQLDEFKELVDLRMSPDQEENSSELFPVILRSQSITQAVLAKSYEFTHDGHSNTITLEKYFNESDPEELSRRLGESFSIAVGKSTGVIDLSLETRYPELSQAVLEEYLRQLEFYNIHGRASQAKSYADYLQRELDVAQVELDSSEERLSRFQSGNLNWSTATDPELARELAKLERDVTMETATFTFLRRELEMARLNVQKDIPVVRVLDSPNVPTRKSSPQRTLLVLLGTVLISCLVVGSVVALHLYRRGSFSDHRSSYDTLRADVKSAFPRSVRLIRKVREKTPFPL